MPKEMRGIPFEALQARPKGEVVDMPRRRENRKAAKESHAENADTRNTAVLDTQDQRQAESLTEQLQFLLKRLDIAKDTLSDPEAVKQLDKNYKDLMNEMQKSVVKYDSTIKPLRADIKGSSSALDAAQKKYDEGSAATKFIRSIFPALDSTGRELAAMRVDLEAKKNKLEAMQEKRGHAANGAKEYNDLVSALHQAEGIVAEINSLTRKAS